MRAGSATVDVQVSYLAGGGAALLPVTLRALVEPKSVRFPDFDDFTIANGDVKEGVEAAGRRLRGGGRGAGGERPSPADGQRCFRRAPSRSTRRAADASPSTACRKYDTPQVLIAELEYPDPNGERLTAATTIPLWPARVLPGLKLDSWAAAKDRLKFDALAVDVHGKPVAGRADSRRSARPAATSRTASA